MDIISLYDYVMKLNSFTWINSNRCTAPLNLCRMKYVVCYTSLYCYTGLSQEENNTAIYPLYVAKCDFVATESDMLSFKEGSLFFIMNKEGDLWYGKAKLSGEEGYVPSSHLEICASLYSYG